MSRTGPSERELERLIEEISVDAHGEDEQLWAFRQVFEDEVALPADAFVIGEPVSVIEIDYDGNTRRGLTARCRREDGTEHVVAASDVVFPEHSGGARYVAAYRKWLGLDPVQAKAPIRSKRQHRAAPEDLDLSGPVELVALSTKGSTARCRLPGRERVVTLRTSGVWNLVPGEIVVVRPHKQWRYASHPYLSGEIESTRLDVAALGLTPLRLESRGTWDPEEEYWGEEGEPIEEWAKPIIARGPRPEFELIGSCFRPVRPGAGPKGLAGLCVPPVSTLCGLGSTGRRAGSSGFVESGRTKQGETGGAPVSAPVRGRGRAQAPCRGAG